MKDLRYFTMLVPIAVLALCLASHAQDDADLDALLGDLDSKAEESAQSDANEVEEAEPGEAGAEEAAGATDMVVAEEDAEDAEKSQDGSAEEGAEKEVQDEAAEAEDDLGAMLGELESREDAEEGSAEAEQDEARTAEEAAQTDGEEAVVAEEVAVEEVGDVEPEEGGKEAAQTNGQEAVVAEDVQPEKGDKEEDKRAKELERQMVIQQQAAEEEGKLRLEAARKAMKDNKTETAIKAFSDALIKIPERPATDKVRQEAREGLVSAYMGQAQTNLKRGSFDRARKSLKEARNKLVNVSPEFEEDAQDGIAGIAEDIDHAEERYAEEHTPEALEIKRVESEEEEIEDLIDSGKEMLGRGDYDKAEDFFKQALSVNPYNKDAMRLLKKVEDYRFKISSVKRQTTVDDMIQDVRESWNPPITAELRTPQKVGGDKEKYTKTATQELRKKMEDIIIPSIEFRQANIVDVISFLRDASEASDPEGVGVNIILKLPGGGRPAETGGGGGGSATEKTGGGVEDDLWAEFEEDTGGGRGRGGEAGGGETESAMEGVSSIPTITLNLRRVSLIDAIKYVTEVADLKYRLEENVVIITPANMVQGKIITRMYPVQPSFLDVVITRKEDEQSRSGGTGGGQFIEMGQSETSMEKSDVKQFFVNSGVKFPQGTSITYNKSISQLIVSNTPENLEVFERILSQLNVIPKQVEIEARFVEVAQNDLEELGFEWLLNDNYEMLVKDGSAPVGGRERIVMNQNADRGGFTQGMRFFSQTESGTGLSSATDGPLYGMGGILGISSILTNPEVSMVLHALDQRGGVDLLSAPRVTTRSGVNAQIKVVREIIYPTEFEMETESVYTGGTTSDDNNNSSRSTQVMVTPEGFETRETGVIMSVTPTVGPDGYTIDLSMVPEVAELVDWIQYGTEQYNIPQPIFSSRSVTTSIVIWDGQTVVMGGMIREQLTTVDDKIPVLGSIPLVGRLFRNKGEYSKKQNLLIFVTARLVDPAGNLIHTPEEVKSNLPAGAAASK